MVGEKWGIKNVRIKVVYNEIKQHMLEGYDGKFKQ